jgi:integrase
VVWLDGHDVYLGLHAKPESRQKYDRLIAEWLANGRRQAPVSQQAQMVDLLAAFTGHAQTYYSGSREFRNFLLAMRPVRSLYGHTPVAEFSPLALRAVRQKFIEGGWCRTYINHQVNRVRHIVKWGVGMGLAPAAVLDALRAVEPLRKNRDANVRESVPVRPVDMEAFEATLNHLRKPLQAAVLMQLHTGARPNEVLSIRPGDVDRSSEVWVYQPNKHKTEHHGHERIIYIGPKAQEVLKPFLLRPTDAFCFSPAEAEKERREQASDDRLRGGTPLSCGNRPGTNRKAHPQRAPGARYTVDSYGKAIAVACKRAFPPPPPLGRHDSESTKAWTERLTPQQRGELRDWRKRHRWHPHQLRHTAATIIRQEFGVEMARIILGHRSVGVTELYAERDLESAREAVRKIG